MRWISFRGRISLGHYWLAYVLPLIALQVLAAGIDLALLARAFWHFPPQLVPAANAAEATFQWWEARAYPWASETAFWLLLVPGLAGMTKRWHDRGASGWWSLLLLIPFIGWIWVFISLCCRDGQRGPNRYGPDPLEPDPLAPVSSGSA